MFQNIRLLSAQCVETYHGCTSGILSHCCLPSIFETTIVVCQVLLNQCVCSQLESQTRTSWGLGLVYPFFQKGRNKELCNSIFQHVWTLELSIPVSQNIWSFELSVRAFRDFRDSMDTAIIGKKPLKRTLTHCDDLATQSRENRKGSHGLPTFGNKDKKLGPSYLYKRVCPHKGDVREFV